MTTTLKAGKVESHSPLVHKHTANIVSLDLYHVIPNDFNSHFLCSLNPFLSFKGTPFTESFFSLITKLYTQSTSYSSLLVL